jgi:hypothetical protein
VSRYITGSDEKLLGVAYGANKFVAVGGGTGGTVMISSNGITWSDPIVIASNRLHAVVYGNGSFLAVGAGGKVAVSVDATNWTESTYGGDQTLSGLAYGNQIYVAAGAEVIAVSTNGVAWQTLALPDYNFEDITYANGTFVAVGNGGLVLSSVDGLTWQRHLTGTDNTLRDITYGQSSFVAIGNNRTILQSGLTSRATLTVTSGPLGPGGFAIAVAGEVGREYTIQASANLADWTELFRQTSLTPTFEYRDTNAATHALRFYRAVTP